MTDELDVYFDEACERFAEKWIPDDNGCWNWTAGTDKDGYGQFKFDGKTWQAHRWAYVQVFGEITQVDEEGRPYELDHRCRNRECVNPEHLRLISHAENTAAMFAARRTARALAHSAALEARERRPSSTSSRLERLERRAQLGELLALEASTEEMAELLGCTEQEVRRELALIKRDTARSAEELVERHRKLQVERLEDLYAAVEPAATAHSHLVGSGEHVYDADGPNPKAVRTALSILVRQAKLLGLDAPVRKAVEHNHKHRVDMTDISDDQLDRLQGDLRARIDSFDSDVPQAEVLQIEEYLPRP